jgi:hypothetical protein
MNQAARDYGNNINRYAEEPNSVNIPQTNKHLLDP